MVMLSLKVSCGKVKLRVKGSHHGDVSITHTDGSITPVCVCLCECFPQHTRLHLKPLLAVMKMNNLTCRLFALLTAATLDMFH